MGALRVAIVLVIVGVLTAAPATADVRVEFHEGRVTVVARDASIQEILAGWARVGGVEILHLEQLSSTPVTIEMTDLPEGEALDILLRSAAGYAAVPRRAGENAPSLYSRVLILAVSTPTPPAVTAAPSAPSPRLRTARVAPPGMVLRRPTFDADSTAQPSTSNPTPAPIGASVPGVIMPAPRQRTLPPGPLPGAEPAYPDAPFPPAPPDDATNEQR